MSRSINFTTFSGIKIPLFPVIVFLTLIVSLNCGAFIPSFLNSEKDRVDMSGLLSAFLQGDNPGQEQLGFAYQVNPQLLNQFGKFYHRRANFPEFRRITDLALVKFQRSLEQEEQSEIDPNLFLLDRYTGTVLFTLGLTGMDAVKDADWKGAKRITLLANGQMAFLDKEDRINLCFRFNATTLVKTPSCTALALKAKYIGAYDERNLVYVTPGGKLVHVNSVTNKTTAIKLPGVSGINHVHVDRSSLTVIFNNYQSLANFEILAPDLPALPMARAEETRLKFINGPFGETTTSAPLQFTGIVRLRDGNYYGTTLTYDMLVQLNPALKPGLTWKYPSLPIPLRRLQDARGLEVLPANNLIHIYSERAVNVYGPSGLLEHLDLNRSVPPELKEVFLSILDVPLKSFEPARDIFTYPEVAPVLEAALGNLDLK